MSDTGTLGPLRARRIRAAVRVSAEDDEAILDRMHLDFAEACGDVESELSIVPDTAHLVTETATRRGAESLLRDLVKTHHGTRVSLGWPVGWVFTFWNFSFGRRYHNLGGRLLRGSYLCCERYLVEMGVVHDPSCDPGRRHPVLLIGEYGRCYVYDAYSDSLYLVSSRSFADLCARGLRDYHPLRETLSVGCPRTDWDDMVMRQFAESADLSEVVMIRDTYLCHESHVSTDGVTRAALVVCDLSRAGYGDDVVDRWTQQADAERIEVIMCYRKWIMSRWFVITIFVDDRLRVYAVDPEDGDARYIAPGIECFLRIGLLRFRNNTRYYRGCFSDSETERAESRDRGFAHRPTSCSRGVFCRRRSGPVPKSGLLARVSTVLGRLRLRM